MRFVLALVAIAACSSPAAEPPAPDAPTWATYTIATGAHDAHLTDRSPKNPTDGVTSAIGRDYDFILDPSAIYTLTNPTDPTDQLDWNKLPGFSDCGETDLSIDGAMFGWRWNVDLSVLELTAYANNASVHLTPDAPLFTLAADDLAARSPMHYRVWREPTQYRFEVTGEVRGRPVDVSATLPRRCADAELDPLAWASALYFGGTSTAPHEITAQIHERRF